MPLLPLLVPLYAEVAHAQPDAAQMQAMLATIDDRQQNSGDWTSLVFIEQKEQGKSDLLYEAVIYRRDVSDKLAILFTKPQQEAGKGYLRLDNNLFFYDPAVGQWERRTERERIGGTGSNRQDFDQSRLAEEYDPTWVETAPLGKYTTEHLKLTVKTGVDVAYPTVELWIDQATGNILKRQDFALSGKLMRTTFYPQWNKLFSPSKNAEVYFPKEIRIFDEVQAGTSTTIVIQQVDLNTLDDSIFTKAWLEAKSR
ncbi:MAG: outer membrane lipoprotein-sorting protein [Alphaproteobacteria bacterium]|nr:outer membrane lipoprotein-sorting protein [Alphaproteobacteria bacterium]